MKRIIENLAFKIFLGVAKTPHFSARFSIPKTRPHQCEPVKPRPSGRGSGEPIRLGRVFVILLGTSHIAEESVAAIETALVKHEPGIVAVELDTARLDALVHKRRKASFFQLVPQVGITGAVFASIGSYIQKKLGAQVGVLPGADMLAAVRCAQKQKLPVFLIDQPIDVTLRRFSAAFTFREKLRLLADVFMAVFFPERQMKKYGVFVLDLSRVPSQKLIVRLIREIRQRYPSLYRVLIQERNEYMVYQLVRLAHQHPDKKILAVVGAGHEEGMQRMLGRVK